MQVRGTVNSLSGGTSRRIALRNGELIPLPPEGQTLCRRKRPPECRRPRKSGAERERGQAQVRAEERGEHLIQDLEHTLRAPPNTQDDLAFPATVSLGV